MNSRIVDELNHLVFDFDGVFTDNKVMVDQNGVEAVTCSRADGLGISLLKKYCKINNKKLDVFVVSTEKNKVVSMRCKKLGIKVIQGIDNKLNLVTELIGSRDLSKVCFVGNDINDLGIILETKFSYCPMDSHPLIKQAAQTILPIKGGNGFVRGVIEDILNPVSLEGLL